MRKVLVLALGVMFGWGGGSAWAAAPLKVGIVGLVHGTWRRFWAGARWSRQARF